MMGNTNNILLEKLERGQQVYGTCITATGPLWPAATARAGLDFVFIDTEHIPLSRQELSALCQSYRARGVVPIARIPSPDPFSACQALDGGAQGIVMPYVESVGQLTELVAAVKYRPLKGELLQDYLAGRREMPGPLRDYIRSFNAPNLCIANIESVPALERLEELLAVAGLDAVFIGPHDLSVSLGLPEQYDHPEFEKAVRTIIHACRARGIHVGIHFSLEPSRQVQWIREGANMVVHSFDIALFTQRLCQDMDFIKKAAGDQPGDSAPGSLVV